MYLHYYHLQNNGVSFFLSVQNLESYSTADLEEHTNKSTGAKSSYIVLLLLLLQFLKVEISLKNH